MNMNHFIQQNNIKVADAIMLRKKVFGMLDHYVIYAGIINGRHRFVANYQNGVNYVDEQDINHYLQFMVPEQLHRFPGRDSERPTAINRAKNLVGKQDYKLLSSNCEHLKNYVHHGSWHSEQAENFGKGVAVVGVAALVLGLFGLLVSEDEKNPNNKA